VNSSSRFADILIASVQKMRLLALLLIFFSAESFAEEEYTLFRENLVNIIGVDNFTQCSPKEVAEYGITESECIKRKKDAETHCVNLVSKLEPNRVTHSQWEQRMNYFWQCRVIATAGCKYTLEAAALIDKINSTPKGVDKTEHHKRLQEILQCKKTSQKHAP